jgi:pyrroline-5-carboxylate reductase
MIKLGVLGVGDLAEKMVRGLLRDANGIAVFLSPRNPEKARALAAEFPCRVMPDNQAVVDAADIVLVSVRPGQVAGLAREVVLRRDQKLISVVSGMPVHELSRIFGTGRCFRAMLSYAAEIGCATIAAYPSDPDVCEVLRRLGDPTVLDSEREFELATVGACMNGWLYFLLHDLQHWLVEKGLPPEHARTLVLGSVADCVAYARHHDSVSMRDLGRSIATSGTFTAQGLEMLGLHQANAAWSAACEVVLDGLLARFEAGNRSDANQVPR